MGEENGMGKEEMRMGEMEGGRAMEVEMARENFYPLPLYSHEDVVKDRALFMDSMRRFHHSMGTKLSIPVLGGKEIDLHLLYKEVTQRGGLEKVILEKKLREVVMAFSFPPTTTSASFVLRNHYLSLLHHYEQVYFFGAQGPPVPPAASCLTKTPKIKLERHPDASDLTTKKSRRRKREHAEPRSKEPHHFTVTGSIDRKFEYGYFVTVKVGQETLHGVLFHVEQPGEASSSASVLPPANAAAMNGAPTEAKRRKKRRRRSSDPAHPKPSRSAYNFYFAEQYSKLKALYPGRDKEFSKMIGESWSRLDAEEKQVYLDRGVEDKERYRKEMEYWEKQKLQQEVMGEELSTAKNDEPE
ncbi:high mobility group B protein 9 [Elaeis guineensis]|uniref:High mobility group B protein 9 n=1 Tax=Elaeis guineensis var. tenera TaxID=51953 RepID=A0A6I9QZE9_ELAGV|nr:high mobility group B protein 9 [Elaeis guineensis]